MANYFDNQNIWSWQVDDNSVKVTTDHGTHTHTLDVTNVPIGDMDENTGVVMGDAHRAASHDFKDDVEVDHTEENTVGPAAENTADVTDGPDNSDGPDMSGGLE